MPDPQVPDVSLDEVEKLIESLLATDPAKVQRVHDFFVKLKAVKPVLDIILKLVAVIH